MKTNPKVVLCDINMQDRPSVTFNLSVAAQVASRFGAVLVPWKAIPSWLTNSRRLGRGELADALIIAQTYSCRVNFLAPRFSIAHFGAHALRHLGQLLIFAVIAPGELASYRFYGLSVGQFAIDSQRRKTMELKAIRFPTRFPPCLGYPVEQLLSPRWTWWLSQSLFRYVFQAWFLAVFWANWLATKKVVASYQLHTERSEFQCLTQLLRAKGTPIWCTLAGEFAPVHGTPAYQTFVREALKGEGRGSRKFSNLGSTPNSPAGSSGDLRFSQRPRFYVRDHLLTPESAAIMKEIEASDTGGYVVVLPASWEAFNHNRQNHYLHSFEKLFKWVDCVASNTCGPGSRVLVKLHPFEPSFLKPYLTDSVSRVVNRSLKSNVTVLPGELSWADLAPYASHLCVVTLSSTSILEVARMGFRVVVCEANEFDVLTFARPPTSKHDLATRLESVWSENKIKTQELELAERLIEAKKDLPHVAATVLQAHSTDSFDLNANLGSSSQAYVASSAGLVLTVHSMTFFSDAIKPILDAHMNDLKASPAPAHD